MGYIKNVYIIILFACFFLKAGIGYGQTSDFNVQHIQDNVARAGATNTTITPVSSVNNAFVLANNNRKTHGGSVSSAGAMHGDDLSGARVLTNTNTLTYYRESSSLNQNMRFNSSIWEYIGPVGGCNEMIVRGRYAVNLNAGTNSTLQAVSGIIDGDKCIPFITGVINNDTSAGADSSTAIAYLESTTNLRVQKGTSSNNVTVYITLVEFTGSNWTVLHGDSGNTNGDSGTIILRNGSGGTGTATNVSNWNDAIIFSHFRADTAASGTNQAIEDLWPRLDPGSNNQRVDWNFQSSSHGSNGTNRHFVHVLSNPDLNVVRFQNSSNTAGETTIDISSVGLSSINEALIVGSSTSNGGGTAYGRGWRNYYLNSITEAAHWAHRSGNTMSHEIQIVDLSDLTSQDIDLVDSSSNAISNGSIDSPLVSNDTEFGDVTVTTSLAKTYTIENNGSCDLTISSISSDNSDFVISSVPGFVLGGATETFTVTYTPTVFGTSTAEITISNNDPDIAEQTYTFTVQGTGIYCASNGNNTSDEYINRVQLNTIDNTPSGSGPGTISTGYSDFTAISTSLSVSSTHTITITPEWTGTVYDEGYSVWIDFNQNGDFSDSGEQVFTQAATTSTTVSGPISIPATALLGTTRMRVSMEYDDIPDPCGSFTWGEVEDYTINITCATNTWTGTVDSDWNDSANWACGGIPISSTDVLIPATLVSGNYPVIYSGDANGFANDIELETGSTLTVEDNYINIAGDLLLNGVIDLNGEGQLIQETGSILDATSSGTIERDQQGAANTYAYNYWGSPVWKDDGSGTNFSAKLEDVLYDGANPVNFVSGLNGSLGSPISIANRWIYKYTDNTGTYAEWQYVGSAGVINTGEGFSMKGPDPSALITDTQNYTFKGLPNNGTIIRVVSSNNEYLVANPYPSAIDGYQFMMDNSPSGTGSLLSGTLYFWEQFTVTNHNLADYQGGYATLTLGGGVPASAYPGLGGGTASKTPQQYIPVAQGFFTESDVDGGNLEFNNDQRIFETEASGNSVFMKPSNTKSKTSSVTKSQEDIRPKYRLGFEATNIGHRQLLLTIDENTTDAVDWGYDGEMNGVVADDMYWVLNDKKYVIQALPDANIDREVLLGIVMSETGLATIQIDALEYVDDAVELYVKDALTDSTSQINNAPFEIELEAGEYNDRFSLVFKPNKVLGIEDDILEKGLSVFMNNNTEELHVNNTTNSELIKIRLFNSLGQVQGVWSENLNNTTNVLSVNNKATGVYIVKIQTTTGVISKKVIIE